MMIMYILWLLLSGLGFVAGVIDLSEGVNPPEDDVITLVLFGLSILTSIFCIFASYQMLRMKSWGISLAATIISLVLGISCCFLPTAIGIWGLVILIDPTVKNHFS